MSEARKSLEKLEQVARKFLEFSFDSKGWKAVEYKENGLDVWCYFADRLDHKSITINEIQVSFFSPVQFNGLTIGNIDTISSLANKTEEFLEELKKTQEALDKEAMEKERLLKIVRLENELNKLKKSK